MPFGGIPHPTADATRTTLLDPENPPLHIDDKSGLL